MVAIAPERGDDEVHAVLHEPADEVHVSRQAIKPRDDEGAPSRLCLLKRCRKPRLEEQGIRSRAGLDILVPGID